MNFNALARLIAISVFILFSGQVFGQELGFGNWAVWKLSGSPQATTTNGGSSLSFYQEQDGKFYWEVRENGLTCAKGESVQAHLSTNTRSASIKLYCFNSQPARFIVQDITLLHSLLQDATVLTVEFPLHNGTAHPVRFSMNGMKAAVAYVLAPAQSPFPPDEPNNGPVIPQMSSAQCQQLWTTYHRCQEEFRRCTVRTHGMGPCPYCALPTCSR